LTRERRRFSEAMMRSVEVGIQRRTVGHNDLDFADVTVAAADDPISAFLISSVILFDHRMRAKLIWILDFLLLLQLSIYIYIYIYNVG
jgi:hypothetical protein